MNEETTKRSLSKESPNRREMGERSGRLRNSRLIHQSIDPVAKSEYEKPNNPELIVRSAMSGKGANEGSRSGRAQEISLFTLSSLASKQQASMYTILESKEGNNFRNKHARKMKPEKTKNDVSFPNSLLINPCSVAKSSASKSPVKSIKIIDQNENTKEANIVTFSLHDIYKSIKRRAGDVSLINNMIKGDTKLLSKDQTIEDFLSKIGIKEASRIQSEGKRQSMLEHLIIEDKELRKTVIKKMKKTLRTFERLCEVGEEKKGKKEKSDKCFYTLEEQINKIMSLPDPEEEKARPTRKKPFSQSKGVSRILQFVQHECGLDVYFLSSLAIQYTRSVYQRTSDKLLQCNIKGTKGNKSKPSKCIKKCPNINERKEHLKLGKEKVLSLLLLNNASLIENAESYKKAHKSKSKVLHKPS